MKTLVFIEKDGEYQYTTITDIDELLLRDIICYDNNEKYLYQPAELEDFYDFGDNNDSESETEISLKTQESFQDYFSNSVYTKSKLMRMKKIELIKLAKKFTKDDTLHKKTKKYLISLIV